MKTIFIGFDPRGAPGFAVTRHTLRQCISSQIPIYGLVLSRLRALGLYTRPTHVRHNIDGYVLWDAISNAPMSTEHANARFLVPHLAREGWALFTDGDMLIRGNIARVFDNLDNSKAVYCVHHNHVPNDKLKMDGQEQMRYYRKNWTSFMLFNCDHPSNKLLTIEMINTLPGRDLHRFCWLKDEEIGELPPIWNWLVRSKPLQDEPQVVHFTEGTPDMAGYERDDYADDWRNALEDWACGGWFAGYQKMAPAA